MRFLPMAFILAGLATAAVAGPPAALSVGSVLNATAGNWTGELQYRDYQSNKWEGLPVKVKIAVQPDGVTMIRTAEFDDGPQTGLVWITTVTQLDSAERNQSYVSFRKGRAVDTGTVTLTMPIPPRDADHWTLVAVETRKDGDSMAEVRETTTRDGDAMVTLKEVNPLNDGKDEWLPRNRLILKRAAPRPKA
jgi:hypothetical protein